MKMVKVIVMAKRNDLHIPVLFKEVLDGFSDVKIATFFDGTLGLGGHAKGILESHLELERYIACDRDDKAIDIARDRLKDWDKKLDIVCGDFSSLDSYLQERKVDYVDGFFLT